MGAWGYGVFDNDINNDFKYLVEKEIDKGVEFKDACRNVSKLDWFNGSDQNEIMLAKAYMCKERNIKLNESGNKKLKRSIINLLEEIDNWVDPNIRNENLLNVAKEFNIDI